MKKNYLNFKSTIIDPQFKSELQAQSLVEQHEYITRYMSLVLEENASFDASWSYLHQVNYLYRKLDQLSDTLGKATILSYPCLNELCENTIFYLLKCSKKMALQIAQMDLATSYWKSTFKVASEDIYANLDGYDTFIHYLEKHFNYKVKTNNAMDAKKLEVIVLLRHSYESLIDSEAKKNVMKEKFPEFSIWLESIYEREKLSLSLSSDLSINESKKSKI
jgi:hypothetical protein